MVRRADPNRHKSKLSADAILIRCRADVIDSVLDELLQIAKNDDMQRKLVQIKTKALGIIEIIERHES